MKWMKQTISIVDHSSIRTQ